MNIERASIPLLAILALAAPAALACSCFRTDTDESRYAKAKHVFTARVTGAKEVRDVQGARVEATMSVTEVFKGSPSKLTRLWSYILYGKDSNSCAVSFTVGEHYIFLIENDGLVHYCSGSKQYNPALDKSVVEGLRALSRPKRSN